MSLADVLDARADVADPEVTFELGQVVPLIGCSYVMAARSASQEDRWGRYLNPAVPPSGSGMRAAYTARDVVVMRLMVDLCNDVRGPLRDQLARHLVAAPWGAPAIAATLGPLAVSYRPRWLTDDELHQPAQPTSPTTTG